MGKVSPQRLHPSAFSLVELLVVVGIIGVVAALLLTAVARARGQAQRVACSSNLRQIGQAFIAYAADNNGSFPAPAGVTRRFAEDWVHWQPGRELRQGRILKYLKNDVRVLNCPSGPDERTTTPPYPYSYSVNNKLTGNGSRGPVFGGNWNVRSCKLSQIAEASMKILAIEEDVTAINDGEWWAGDTEDGIWRTTSLSVIHDRRREYGGGSAVDTDYHHRGRGNVVFADGHCDFIHRTRLLRSGWTDPHRHGGPY